MKEGDKIYCIKNKSAINDVNNVTNIKGKTYFISHIGKIDNKPYVIFVTCEVGGNIMYKYKNDSQPVNNGAGYFYNYFITLKELRKQKITTIEKHTTIEKI